MIAPAGCWTPPTSTAVMAEPAPARHGSGAAITEDGLLEGRVKLCQPKKGYRVAIDSVFLAAAVPAIAGERVLDVGAGTGAASLCLAWRVPRCRVSGIEVQPDMARLASHNIGLNGFTGRVDVMTGDLTRPPMRLAPGSFDHVMANPPYIESGRANPSPDRGRAGANVEGAASAGGQRAAGGGGLGDWVRFCLAMVRRKGTLTVVHRADRLDALLAELHGRAGDIVVYPLWPGYSGKPAKRVLVRAVAGAFGPMRLATGMVLHEEDGSFTARAEAVLRRGEGLEL